MAALEEAYKGNIMTGKFPGCVLHMTMDYSTLDVNVHPSKLEVRFTNERPIFDAVYHGVKSALLSGDNRSPIKEEEPIKPEILEKQPQRLKTSNYSLVINRKQQNLLKRLRKFLKRIRFLKEIQRKNPFKKVLSLIILKKIKMSLKYLCLSLQAFLR